MKRFVAAMYRYIGMHTTGAFFCLCMNFLFLLRGLPDRFYVKGRQLYLSPKLSKTEIACSNYRQAVYAFKNGIEARFEYLSRVYFINLINWKEGDLIIDCGANIGELGKLIQDYYPGLTKYIAVEPSPTELISLKKNIDLSMVRPKALWNSEDQLTFFVSSDCADSSLIEPQTYSEKITVPTVLFDEEFSGIQSIKFFKLEAEGAEPEILKGAIKSLKKIEYISADLGFERGKSAESTFIPVTNFLLSRGFALVKLDYVRMTALYVNLGLQEGAS